MTEPAAADTFDRLAERFLDDRRRGRHPSIEDYARDHPDHASQIRHLFPALLVLEDLKPDPVAPRVQPSHVQASHSTRRYSRALRRITTVTHFWPYAGRDDVRFLERIGFASQMDIHVTQS